MTSTLAYECYADRDVFLFLKNERKIALGELHGYSQGEVINDVFVRKRADVGMVDEDPGRSHHGLRDQMKIEKETQDVQLRALGGRFLIVIKPDLERCFLESVKRLNFHSKLPGSAGDLHRLLNVPDRPHPHHVFRGELAALRQASLSRKISTFVTDLESILRELAL